MQNAITRVIKQKKTGSKTNTKIFSLIFVLAVISGGALFSMSAGKSVASDITAEKVSELTNKSRDEAGKNRLIANSKLARAAEAKAEDMLANDYFSHTSPAGVTPWIWIQGADYEYNFAGENLAMDFHAAEKMEEAWMASPTHRANILNEKYSELGVAVKAGNINGRGTTLAVVMFGSGDKNSSSPEKIQTEIAKPVSVSKSENKFPALPVGEKKMNAARFERTVILSPQSGETVSDPKIRIFGRARPGEKISVLDGDDILDSAVANPDGWFSLPEKELDAGTHSLALQEKNIIFENKTVFSVDYEKPEIDFRLYADKTKPRLLYLAASASKNDCAFQFNGESRNVSRKDKSLFVVEAGKSSAILRVEDRAGNKNFEQINFANYYFSNEKNNISDKLAGLMAAPKNIFAANSGREALKNNLRLSMGGYK